jgi:selenocysteine lyase/cysteine desulfurase
MPDRDEAGSPNVMGAVAMAAAAKTLMDHGMDSVAEHERVLTEYALRKLGEMGDIHIYGETDPNRASEKVGVIPFNLEGTDHALLAAVAGFEFGVGVRNGCFCAHPYVVELLRLHESEIEEWRRQFLMGDKSRMPGMVRMSFGCYSDHEDVDRLLEAIDRIRDGDFIGDYSQIPETGEFIPSGYTDDFSSYWKYPDRV